MFYVLFAVVTILRRDAVSHDIDDKAAWNAQNEFGLDSRVIAEFSLYCCVSLIAHSFQRYQQESLASS